MAADSKLFLKIYTRSGVVFDQQIESLTSYNLEGRFDVLREHSQFISIIRNKVVARLPDGRDQQIPVNNAVMRVKGNKVEVFLGVKQ